MDQSQQVEHLSKFADISKAAAGRILKELATMITAELKTSGRFRLNDIGVFVLRQRSAGETTIMKGPDTGKKVLVAAHKGVGFKAGKALKEAVNK